MFPADFPTIFATTWWGAPGALGSSFRRAATIRATQMAWKKRPRSSQRKPRLWFNQPKLGDLKTEVFENVLWKIRTSWNFKNGHPQVSQAPSSTDGQVGPWQPNKLPEVAGDDRHKGSMVWFHHVSLSENRIFMGIQHETRKKNPNA